MKRWWMTMLLICAMTAAAAKISKTEFEQLGSTRLPEEQLLISIQQRPGVEYRPEEVNADVKRLFGTGAFADVTSESTPLPDGSMKIVYKLKSKPRVKAVKLSGNAKFNNHELYKEITLGTEQPLNDAKLIESTGKLRDFYNSKGYHSATVTSEIVRPDAGSDDIEVIFHINEHLRYKVNNVTFEGNSVFGSWKLKYSIANRYSPLSWLFDVGLFNRDELELDKARLRELYWNEGYLDFEISDLTVTPDPDDPEFVDLHFKLSEGEPYLVGKVTVSGNTVYPEDELLERVRLQPGRLFSFQDELDSQDAVTAPYNQLGYADVSARAVRSPDYENHTVDVDFQISEGRKYTVHDIIISGNKVTKDRVLRRELAVQPGDPVDKMRIDATRNRLLGMGYFNKVEATTTNADSLDEKDVRLEVEERNMFEFKIGGGFSDVNSLMGMAEISSNNFDLFAPGNWFTGGGQRLRLQGLYGIERAGFNLDFTEPWLFDIPLRFDLSGYMNQLEYENWTEDRTGVRTGLSYKIFDDFTTLSGGYKFEYVKVRDMDRGVSRELWKQQGGEYVSQFSLMLDRDTRDSLIEPTEGYNLNLLGAISPKMLGSSQDFYRIEAKGSVYYPLFDKAIITMLGARVGTISTFGGDGEAPLFERYFMGGGDSLRGFPFREVSPLDSRGFQQGGQTMLLATAEISHPIWRFIRGAVFTDVGNVWSDSYDFGKVNIGVGYGLRIKVPYLNAPIKLDLAYPVLNNQPDLKSKIRFHFNMGFTW